MKKKTILDKLKDKYATEKKMADYQLRLANLSKSGQGNSEYARLLHSAIRYSRIKIQRIDSEIRLECA